MSGKQVITLIAPALGSDTVKQLQQALQNAGAYIIESRWLQEAEACDILFSQLLPEEATRLAGEALAGQAVDYIVQDAATRQKRLLICDMDSTIIEQECIDELADFAGLKQQVSAITERAMNGELDFSDALRERVRLLKGLSEAVLQEAFDTRITLMPGAKTLVQTMKAQGAHCLLVSGGFTFFTSRVREAVGFDADHSNQLAVENGVLTGAVIEPILGAQAKLQTLMSQTIARGLSLGDTMAVGDGANDLPMLMAAGLGVAYHAKPVVQQSARNRINYCDLSALLYSQGIEKTEWK